MLTISKCCTGVCGGCCHVSHQSFASLSCPLSETHVCAELLNSRLKFRMYFSRAYRAASDQSTAIPEYAKIFPMSKLPLPKRVAAEFVGTAFLVAAVVGSGIMAERLAGGNVALALLANTIATGAALIALILAFGAISGAHFNPAVTVADALETGIPWREVPAYIAAQCLGGVTGTATAHLMFGRAVFSLSQHVRSGPSQWFSEFIAAFGLLMVIWGCSRLRASAVPFAVGAYITAAYWFTASTSFANPAVTLARALSDSFSGIRPSDVPLFIVAQMCGALAATGLFRWLVPSLPGTAEDILLPHPSPRPVKTYLFACVHNAGRSQMAAALFNFYADSAGCHAISAGTQPSSHVHPEVVEAMREIGIDLGSVQPQKLTDELASTASVLITMGCGEACPFVPGLRRLDWPLLDPKGQTRDAVRAIRDQIQEKVKHLIHSECADCVVNRSC
jgi:glycerol uptake facilitator-like aquaporin